MSSHPPDSDPKTGDNNWIDRCVAEATQRSPGIGTLAAERMTTLLAAELCEKQLAAGGLTTIAADLIAKNNTPDSSDQPQ
jgi:hypothetical protein